MPPDPAEDGPIIRDLYQLLLESGECFWTLAVQQQHVHIEDPHHAIRHVLILVVSLADSGDNLSAMLVDKRRGILDAMNSVFAG